ncbi:response regulator transcription factor [Rickettsiales bacterium LUAb2]
MNNNQNIHILIIDDDQKIASLLQQILINNNFIVTTAFDIAEAESILNYFQCNIIILDYMLGEVTGLDFLSKLRSQNILTPVIMLTASNEIDVKLQSLSIGADDYLSKPFNSTELILRIKNLLKRSNVIPNSQIISFCNMQFNSSSGELQKNGNIIQLSNQEEQLLQIFTNNLGKVVSKEQILQITGKALTEENLNTINVNIMRLRKKIEDEEGINKCLKTIRNQGFLLRP